MTNLPTTPSKFSFATTIRPGLLVAVSTSIKGNVSYSKKDLETAKLENGVDFASWETERRIKDAAEQEAATQTVGKAVNLVKSVCSKTEFGYLCPIISKPELNKAIAEGHALVNAFNATSKVTKARFIAVTGTIAQDDYQAVRALRREVSELLLDMKQGLENLDVATVREAAGRATQLGQMLTEEAQVRLAIAVKQAREVAKKIVKAGETGAAEIDRATLARLTEARTAFLDIDSPDGEIGSPLVEGRGVDFAPADEAKQAAPAVAGRQIEC